MHTTQPKYSSATLTDKSADVQQIVLVNLALDEAIKIAIKKRTKHDSCLLHACSCMQNEQNWYRNIM